jgi:hypothetical protein
MIFNFYRKKNEIPSTINTHNKVVIIKMGGVYSNSLYSATCDKMHDDLIDLLGFDPDNCPRFRSVEVCGNKPRVSVRGRCGGGNRADHYGGINTMKNESGFHNSFDMSSDCTYMCFIYKVNKAKWKKFVNKYKGNFTVEGEDDDAVRSYGYDDSDDSDDSEGSIDGKEEEI